MKWRVSFFIMTFLSAATSYAQAGFQFDYNSDEFKEVASQFLCNCGCGQNVFDCDMSNCGNSTAFKREIAELILKGWDSDQIREHYVRMNGESILMAPQTEGFSLMAWVLPFAVLFLGAVIVYFAVRRWVKRNEAKTRDQEGKEASLPEEAEDENMKSMIEQERKKYL
ncbi:cytochrome c-type biogenesis protein [Paenibacillus sp. Dod16]|uniref:cytochrome c-type biogenesis protein n=1 Tax=Paenibacillus sp. Dod16 TaxID=3416392 RepID=UPI003CFAE81F